MGLDVYLKSDASLPTRSDERFLSFEDDGYFGFLYEFFKDLIEQTGQTIELYDDAFFSGENLDLLSEKIQQAKEAVSQKPETWDEFIGTTFQKGEKTKVEKIFSTVQKKELVGILSKMEMAISKAKEKNFGIFFFGD